LNQAKPEDYCPCTNRGMVMALRHMVCEFEPCRSEYASDTTKRRFCSDECRRAHEILAWAPRLMELRAEGKTHNEVGKALGISRNAALIRALRLHRHRERYPFVDKVLSMKEENDGIHMGDRSG